MSANDNLKLNNRFKSIYSINYHYDSFESVDDSIETPYSLVKKLISLSIEENSFEFLLIPNKQKFFCKKTKDSFDIYSDVDIVNKNIEICLSSILSTEGAVLSIGSRKEYLLSFVKHNKHFLLKRLEWEEMKEAFYFYNENIVRFIDYLDGSNLIILGHDADPIYLLSIEE